MSFPAHRELAEMFVPKVASEKANDAKNAAARLSQLSMRRSGSQNMPLYRTAPALVTAMPINPQNVNATGIIII